MSNNCDDPNIIPPNGTAKQVKGKTGSRNRKPLPNTTSATNVTVSGGKVNPSSNNATDTAASQAALAAAAGGGGGGGSPAVAGGKVKASSTPPGAVQPTAQVNPQTQTPTVEKPQVNQWTQPKTEHGRINGEKIEEKDPCNGQEKKSEEFKPRTIYPFNKVTQTESGHVTETDDTPGSERVSFFHRSGSNYEYFPNGDVIHQNVRDNYIHVFRDNYVHLGGYSTVTIDKGLKILVNSDEDDNTPEKNVNFDIHISGNANVNIYVHKGNMNVSLAEGDLNMRVNKGDVNILQDQGNYNHTVGGDYNLEVVGHMHTVVGGNVIHEIGGNRDERIDGEFDQKYLTNPSGYYAEYLEGAKRVYVSGNQIVQVAGNSDESAKIKTEKYSNTMTVDIYGYGMIRAGGTLDVTSGTDLTLHSSGTMLIKSFANMDIFSSIDGISPMKLYSAASFEFVAENYALIRSSSDKIELKAPQNIKTITPKLYIPETETAPRFGRDPKPINDKDPYLNKVTDAKTTNTYLKNNKKPWVPTNTKNK